MNISSSHGTSALMAFRHEHQRLVDFIRFVMGTAEAEDGLRKTALRAASKLDGDPVAEDLARIDREGAMYALRNRHRRLLLELVICRAVDGFLGYLSDLIAEIFRTKPETLRSSRQIRVDQVLKHDTMQELIHELAERQVNDLSYQGMRDLAENVSDRFGLKLFVSDTDFHRAIRIVESRNLIVHNHGIVSKVFLKRVPAASHQLGEQLPLGAHELFDDVNFLAGTVVEFDAQAVAKFRLETCGDDPGVDGVEPAPSGHS